MSRKRTRIHHPRHRFTFGEVSGVPYITDRKLDLDWTREFEKLKREVAKKPGSSSDKLATLMTVVAAVNRRFVPDSPGEEESS